MRRRENQPARARVISSLAWLLAISSMATAVLFDRRLRHMGRSDLVRFAPEAWIVIAAIVVVMAIALASVLLRIRLRNRLIRPPAECSRFASLNAREAPYSYIQEICAYRVYQRG